ncbi:MAG: hypothetical protein GF398_08545 [Chitinivibrionales bacterium]|nr:hypothetical protein [Chitinivibrionales bacterium]
MTLAFVVFSPAAFGATEGMLIAEGAQKTFTAHKEGVEAFPADKLHQLELNEGVEFVLQAERAWYHPGDKMVLSYKITNTNEWPVEYNFSLGCRYDMIIKSLSGDTLYDYAGSHPCPLAPSRLKLVPGSSDEIVFPAFTVPELSGKLIISASMRGYRQGTISALAKVAESSAARESMLANEKSLPPKLHFDRAERVLKLSLNRSQSVALSVYILNGQKIGQLSREKFFRAGTHSFSLKNIQLGEGMLVVRIKGSGFSETKTINLM